MAKVHSSHEISSPYFPQDFADYLIESGYVLRVVQNDFHSYAFEKDGEKYIQIIRDWVHLLVWNEEEPDQRLAEWSSVHQFSGISALKHRLLFVRATAAHYGRSQHTREFPKNQQHI